MYPGNDLTLKSMFKPPKSINNTAIPIMRRAKQNFSIPPSIVISDTIDEQWKNLKGYIDHISGKKIAVCVGSRGISKIVEIVREVISKLRSVGAHPFIVPAMGSHGGGEAAGQREVLTQLGITEESVSVPVVADMEVVSLGEVDGIPLFMSKSAYNADGIVVINRVKPHTDFNGPLESGIFKMLVIGLGNQKGADYYHRMAVKRGFYDMIVTAGRALLAKTRFLFGTAVVENQRHETCDLKIVLPNELEKTEQELLALARGYLPKLPLDDIDLLIIDQMGKDFSGTGIDPNVVGASPSMWNVQPVLPNVSRIFVRQLSKASKGNATGIDMVDIATPQLLDKVDWQVTAMNAYTACLPGACRAPMTVSTEKEAILVALNTIRPYTLGNLKIIHIKNTLELNELYLSEGCLSELKPENSVSIEPDLLNIVFDKTGNLEYR